jgi:hypothetical protein
MTMSKQKVFYVKVVFPDKILQRINRSCHIYQGSFSGLRTIQQIAIGLDAAGYLA